MAKNLKDALTYKVIGCAMRVHSVLGNGFQEVIYQRALSIEMKDNSIDHMREVEMEIFYKKIRIGKRRVDFFVENRILLELKAVIELEEAHLAQAMNYCQVCNLPYGLLINFGARSLEYKRVYNFNHPDDKKQSKEN